MGETLQEKNPGQLTEKETAHAAEVKPALPTAQMGFALVQHTDMPSEMTQEVLEIVIVACEKYADNLEQASKIIKDEMEHKFHGHWHVVVGGAFGFEISHEKKKVLFTFFGGTLAVLIWCM